MLSQHPVVHGAFVETIVPADQGVPERGLCLVNLLDVVVEFAQLRPRHRPPVRRAATGRINEVRDLGQRETGQFEQVDERDLLNRALVVGPLAPDPAGGAQQTLAFVETQRRRREPGAGPELRDRQLVHLT